MDVLEKAIISSLISEGFDDVDKLNATYNLSAVNGTLGALSAVKVGNLVAGNARIKDLSAYKNSWLNLCYTDHHPIGICNFSSFLNNDGTLCAIVQFLTSGMGAIYPLNDLNSAEINFTFAYKSQ